MTDTGNHAYTKPTIKIKKNNKLKSKHANVNMNNFNNTDKIFYYPQPSNFLSLIGKPSFIISKA